MKFLLQNDSPLPSLDPAELRCKFPQHCQLWKKFSRYEAENISKRREKKNWVDEASSHHSSDHSDSLAVSMPLLVLLFHQPTKLLFREKIVVHSLDTHFKTKISIIH